MDARSASTGRGSHRNLEFPRAGRRLPRLLHVYVTTARRLDAAPSVVFVDDAARVLDRIPLERVSRDDPHSALHGIVCALWKARRLGYRRVEVHCDDPAAVAQMNGEREIDAGAVGLYLEARALRHLYTNARIDLDERPQPAPASAASRPECAMSFSS